MRRFTETLTVKTRLPLAAWVFAGLVTIFSLVSTLMQVPANDQANATDMAQAVKQDMSGNKGIIAASTIR
ncbi:MAG TPA: hypothetical protein VNO69_06955 [Methyloceanibacter sp.]|nr:hypothetical protein [Methyloceanibacter sp.]